MTEIDAIQAVTREQVKRARSCYVPHAFKFMNGAMTVYVSPKFMSLIWAAIVPTPQPDGEAGR